MKRNHSVPSPCVGPPKAQLKAGSEASVVAAAFETTVDDPQVTSRGAAQVSFEGATPLVISTDPEPSSPAKPPPTRMMYWRPATTGVEVTELKPPHAPPSSLLASGSTTPVVMLAQSRTS